MTGSEPLGDDEIERLSQRLRRAVAEDPLRPWAPESYDSLTIAGHDRIRMRRQDHPADEFVSGCEVRCHVSPPRLSPLLQARKLMYVVLHVRRNIVDNGV